MAPAQQDLYTVLGVLREASPDEIRRAYHAAARKLHPDQNKLPGETELFLEVQRAYEVLSNPERRSRYDATLAPEEPADAPIHLQVDYSRDNLVRLEEPQLLYALLGAAPPEQSETSTLAPLNVCLVLDRSTSMQGEKMEVAKNAALRILDMLRADDLFSLVVFSDRAEVLLPSTFQRDLKRARSRVQSIRPGGATEIRRGMEAALGQLRDGLDPNRGNHLILLTDGHTYGDEQACLLLAEEAAQLNIGISGFGVGGDWNDIFLDSLSAKTGGNSTYIMQPQDIADVLTEKFTALARSFVDDCVLEHEPISGVQLRSCHRLQPEGGPIEVGQPVHLGPIRQDAPLSVLLEFVVEPETSKAEEVTLLDGHIRLVVGGRSVQLPPIRILLSRPCGNVASETPPPQQIVNALSRLSLYRLQERARNESEAGDHQSATRHLRNLALQLQAQGQHDLAKTALLEAESLERSQVFSDEGRKQIKYGTRALLEPNVETPE